jgi:hypothetical protein
MKRQPADDEDAYFSLAQQASPTAISRFIIFQRCRSVQGAFPLRSVRPHVLGAIATSLATLSGGGRAPRRLASRSSVSRVGAGSAMARADRPQAKRRDRGRSGRPCRRDRGRTHQARSNIETKTFSASAARSRGSRALSSPPNALAQSTPNCAPSVSSRQRRPY